MLVVQSKSLEEIQLLAEKKEEFLAAIPSIQPIKRRSKAHGFWLWLAH